jgi:uncharacterized membrane protein YhaH (DUF805 family)
LKTAVAGLSTTVASWLGQKSSGAEAQPNTSFKPSNPPQWSPQPKPGGPMFPVSHAPGGHKEAITDAVRKCLSLALTLNGRTARSEYWYFTAATVGGLFVLALLLGAMDPSFTLLVLIAAAVPHITATVRRLHDINRAGFWILIGVIPFVMFVGIFVLIYWLVQPGDPNDNQFGPPP